MSLYTFSASEYRRMIRALNADDRKSFLRCTSNVSIPFRDDSPEELYDLVTAYRMQCGLYWEDRNPDLYAGVVDIKHEIMAKNEQLHFLIGTNDLEKLLEDVLFK